MSAEVDDAVSARARSAVLWRQEWFPSPAQARPVTVAELSASPSVLRDALAPAGLALFEISGPLDTARFIEVASVLGVPEPETERSLMHRVDSGVVLNLRPDSAEPVTEHSQPFTDSPLTFHTEGSRRPLGASPSWLLFHCVTAPEPDRGGQTLLRSAHEVLDTLSEPSRAVLARTVLTPESTDASVICELDGRPRLNFRDPAPAPFTWRSPFGDRQVTEALAELLRRLYDVAAVGGIHWRDGQLAVIDNSRWLHARSGGHGGSRHLRRIRISAGGRGRS
jgi:alpha-ketoglutarate-dependent taurine dioxygenase